MSTMDCPHGCVACPTCEESSAARKIRAMQRALESIVVIMSDREKFVLMGPRAAAPVERIARDAPPWLGPLIMLVGCCVTAGGSVDVAVRTGYWGLCSGVAVASVTIFICSLIIFPKGGPDA